MKYSLHLFQVPAYNIKKKKGMSMEKFPKRNIPRNAQKCRPNDNQIRYCVSEAKEHRSPTKYPFVENAQYKRKINNCMNIKKTQQPKGCRVFLVPVAGLEPARCCHHQILSLARLPIPSHRQIIAAGGTPTAKSLYSIHSLFFKHKIRWR